MNRQTHAWLEVYGDVRWNEPLARHTTIRLGGPASAFIRVIDRAKCLELIECLEQANVPWRVLAGGSNVIASDRPLDEVVIQPGFSTMRIGDDGVVAAEVGCVTALFARRVTEAGYMGWEWGVGLPGMIGGAIVGNAGCFGGETRDSLQEVVWWNASTRTVERLSADACKFRYRDSRFKHERGFVLEASWTLVRAPDPQASLARLNSVLAERKAHQPLGAASAGCVFANLELPPEKIEKLEQELGATVPTAAKARGVVPAGWLIERLGLKGKAFGSVSVSALHANFFLTTSATRAEDVDRLRAHIQTLVHQRFGLHLEPEARYWGFDTASGVVS